MPLIEIKSFNAVIDNKHYFDRPLKMNKKQMKKLSRSQETVTIQQESYYITHTTKLL